MIKEAAHRTGASVAGDKLPRLTGDLRRSLYAAKPREDFTGRRLRSEEAVKRNPSASFILRS